MCQPCNPGGTACYAFIVKDEENIIYSEYGLAAYDSTNNVAEWLIANNYEDENIIIRGDSRLVISQIKGQFKVKAPNIIPLYHSI